MKRQPFQTRSAMTIRALLPLIMGAWGGCETDASNFDFDEGPSLHDSSRDEASDGGHDGPGGMSGPGGSHGWRGPGGPADEGDAGDLDGPNGSGSPAGRSVIIEDLNGHGPPGSSGGQGDRVSLRLGRQAAPQCALLDASLERIGSALMQLPDAEREAFVGACSTSLAFLRCHSAVYVIEYLCAQDREKRDMVLANSQTWRALGSRSVDRTLRTMLETPTAKLRAIFGLAASEAGFAVDDIEWGRCQRVAGGQS